jgi:hypothetical protein
MSLLKEALVEKSILKELFLRNSRGK